MDTLVFSTGNGEKFIIAKHVCDKFDIAIEQNDIDVVEIQDENPENVAIDKANKAFNITKKAVVITDDSWAFLGLSGFPGVYMHSINHWFTAQDFLNLTRPLSDKRVTLTQYLVYKDADITKVFTNQTNGLLLDKISGKSDFPSHMIMSLEGDDGLSIAEAHDRAKDKSGRQAAKVWHDFARWYTQEQTR